VKAKQESLANAKVSAQQQCMYEGHLAKKSTASTQRKEHKVEKYIQWVTTLSLTIRISIRLAIVASQICKIPQTSPKIQT